jgi:inorganic pyrophosphatase
MEQGSISAEFWQLVDRLVAESEMVIDRPQGSAHPRYPELIYPLDYGYLAGATAGDGHGIDLWLGSRGDREINGLLCTVDLFKRDMEIKLLLGCTEAEDLLLLPRN